MDKRSRTSLIITIAAIVLCLLACIVCYFIFIDKPIEYPDVIFSMISEGNIDKVSEVNFIFCTIIIFSVGVTLLPKKLFAVSQELKQKKHFDEFAVPFAALIVNVFFYSINGNFNRFLLECLFIIFFVYIKYGPCSTVDCIQRSIKYLILLLTVKLAYLAFFNGILLWNDFKLFSVIQHGIKIDSNSLDYFSYLTILAVLIGFYKREDVTEKIILWGQKITPFSLIFLFSSSYLNSQTGELVRLPLPVKYTIICVVLIAGIFLMQFTKKNRKEIINLPFLITLGLVKLVSVKGLFFNGDLWHIGEELVPYEQIFTFSRTPFKDFFPSSGLYSFLEGSVMDHIFDKNYMSMDYVFTIETIIFVLAIVTIFYFIFDNKVTFFLVVFLLGDAIDRFYLIFILYFLLQLKWLNKRPVVWLGTWILCCLINVLIYPLYGLAFSLGTLSKVYMIVKETTGEQKPASKSKFPIPHVIFLIFSIAMVILCTPLGLRMAKSMLLFRDYTVFADGIPVIGTAMNLSFYTVIKSLHYGDMLYQIILLSMIILFPVVILICTKAFWHEAKKTQVISALLFSIIYTIFAYNFTIIRMDPASYLARNAYIYKFITIVFFTALLKLYAESTNGRAYLYIILISLSVWSFTLITPGVQPKFAYSFPVSEEDIYIEESNLGVPNLGYGFIQEEPLKKLTNLIEIVNRYDTSFWSFDGRQSYYFILNKEVGFSTAGSFVALSSEMQKYYLDNAENMPNIIINNTELMRLHNYYIYKQLLLDDNYVMTMEANNFILISRDYYNEYFGRDIKSSEDINKAFLKRQEYGAFNLGLSSASWGKSYQSLEHRFSRDTSIDFDRISVFLEGIEKKGETYTISQSGQATITYQFNQAFNGATNDFIYFDLNTAFNKKDLFWVSFYFNGGNKEKDAYQRVSCCVGEGHLLVPMGVNPNWLYNMIDEITIDLSSFPEGTQFEITAFELLEYTPF